MLIGRFSFLKNLSDLYFQKLTKTLFGSEIRLYNRKEYGFKSVVIYQLSLCFDWRIRNADLWFMKYSGMLFVTRCSYSISLMLNAAMQFYFSQRLRDVFFFHAATQVFITARCTRDFRKGLNFFDLRTRNTDLRFQKWGSNESKQYRPYFFGSPQ